MRFLTSLLIVGLVLGSGVATAQIEHEVSDVTGVERYVSPDMRSLYAEQYAGDNASYRAEYVNDPDEGVSWIVAVYGFADGETSISRTDQFRVEADGEVFEPLRLESRTRSLDDAIIEIKRATFTRPAFETIAHADDVTISIGDAQFTAIHPRRQDMRRILERAPREDAPPTATTESQDESP